MTPARSTSTLIARIRAADVRAALEEAEADGRLVCTDCAADISAREEWANNGRCAECAIEVARDRAADWRGEEWPL